MVNVFLWVCSPPAPLKVSMVPRLCVPETHLFVARNWNLASGGLSLTALMVANSVGVSTPLSGPRSFFGS